MSKDELTGLFDKPNKISLTKTGSGRLHLHHEIMTEAKDMMAISGGYYLIRVNHKKKRIELYPAGAYGVAGGCVVD